MCVEDVEGLKDFPVREYILTPNDQQALYFGLLDIIAAYCYDHRTTEGDPTSESAWTINKLSATLSWFEVIVYCMAPSLKFKVWKTFLSTLPVYYCNRKVNVVPISKQCNHYECFRVIFHKELNSII